MRMRIGLVVSGGLDRSGRERVTPSLLWLIERLARRHDVHAFVLDYYPEPCSYPLLGATVHDIGRVEAAPGLRRGRQRRRLSTAIEAQRPVRSAARLSGHAGDRLRADRAAPWRPARRHPRQRRADDDRGHRLRTAAALARSTRAGIRAARGLPGDGVHQLHVGDDGRRRLRVADHHRAARRRRPLFSTRGAGRWTTVAAAAGRQPQCGEGSCDPARRARAPRPHRPRAPPRRRRRGHHERPDPGADADTGPGVTRHLPRISADRPAAGLLRARAPAPRVIASRGGGGRRARGGGQRSGDRRHVRRVRGRLASGSCCRGAGRECRGACQCHRRPAPGAVAARGPGVGRARMDAQRTTRTGPPRSSSGFTARLRGRGSEGSRGSERCSRCSRFAGARGARARKVLEVLRVRPAQRPPDDRLAQCDADRGARAAERGNERGAGAQLHQ